ncbi:MAG: hypothetical protein ACLVJ6_14360 [Merdibacter sp.]
MREVEIIVDEAKKDRYPWICIAPQAGIPIVTACAHIDSLASGYTRRLLARCGQGAQQLKEIDSEAFRALIEGIEDPFNSGKDPAHMRPAVMG